MPTDQEKGSYVWQRCYACGHWLGFMVTTRQIGQSPANASGALKDGKTRNGVTVMPIELTAGDWVRFRRGGVLVIGQVEYVRPRDGWDSTLMYQTDIGAVDRAHILEIRRKES